MTEGSVFIGTIVIALTEALKSIDNRINGYITVVVAGLIGLLVAVVDTHIGIQDITIAQGILTGLSAVGVVTVAKKV